MKRPSQQGCLKCNSINWDWADIGFSGAKQCLDCGEIYMMKDKTIMTESEFEAKFDNGGFDCEFAEFLFDKYDASNEHKLETRWLLKGHIVTLKLMMVTEPSTLLQDAYFEGKNPLDSFPTIKG